MNMRCTGVRYVRSRSVVKVDIGLRAAWIEAPTALDDQRLGSIPGHRSTHGRPTG